MATTAGLTFSRVKCRARSIHSQAKANWPDKVSDVCMLCSPRAVQLIVVESTICSLLAQAMPPTRIHQHPELLLPNEMRKSMPLLPVPKLKRRRVKTMTPEIQREIKLEQQEYEYYKTKHMETYMHLTRKVQFWREGFR